jgi:hypothetical protein
MSWFVLPSLALALSAWVLVFLRTRELVWRAPLDAPRLVQALRGPLADGRLAEVQAICERLRSGWAADVVLRALRELDDLASVLEEACAHWEQVSERHALAIAAFGRIAVPLALASAIVQLGAGFQAHVTLARVQAELNAALTSGTLGLMTLALCRYGAARLERHAHARMREVGLLSEMLLADATRRAKLGVLTVR